MTQLSSCFIYMSVALALAACDGMGDGAREGEGEGEGEGVLCQTATNIVACGPIFDDSRCPALFPFATTPCEVNNLVCTWCNINGGGATQSLWCDEAGNPPTWQAPASCIEEE